MRIAPDTLTLTFEDADDAVLWSNLAIAGLGQAVGVALVSKEPVPEDATERISRAIAELVAACTALRLAVEDDELLEQLDIVLGDPDVTDTNVTTLFGLQAAWTDFTDSLHGQN